MWKCIQYTIHWDKTQVLKKLLRTKYTVQNMQSFLFDELQLITVLLLICNSYMSWSTMFVSLKQRCVGFSIFNSVSFLLKSDSPLPKKFFICFYGSPLKMKNAFYFILKALFVLRIFKFLSWLFGHREKTAWLER